MPLRSLPRRRCPRPPLRRSSAPAGRSAGSGTRAGRRRRSGPDRSGPPASPQRSPWPATRLRRAAAGPRRARAGRCRRGRGPRWPRFRLATKPRGRGSPRAPSAVVEAADRLDFPQLAQGAGVELELELALFGELRRRPGLGAGLVVVDDAEAPVRGYVHPVDLAVDPDPVDVERRHLAVAVVAEGRLEQRRPKLGLAEGLAVQEALDLRPHAGGQDPGPGQAGLEALPFGFLREQGRRAPPPPGDVARTGNPVVAGRLRVEALEHLVDDRAGGQLIGLGLEPLRLELVFHEPPVGALDPLLDRARPDLIAPLELGQHPGVGERAREGLA